MNTGPSNKAGSKSDKGGFSEAEKTAMKERAQELRSESGWKGRGGMKKGERDLLAKIEEMPEPDKGMAARLHEIVMEAAPQLEPRTWYGMPAWSKEGKVICFFQGAQKYDARYSTFNFNDSASLDDGPMWPIGFGLTELTPQVEKELARLVSKAVGG